MGFQQALFPVITVRQGSDAEVAHRCKHDVLEGDKAGGNVRASSDRSSGLGDVHVRKQDAGYVGVPVEAKDLVLWIRGVFQLIAVRNGLHAPTARDTPLCQYGVRHEGPEN